MGTRPFVQGFRHGWRCDAGRRAGTEPCDPQGSMRITDMTKGRHITLDDIAKRLKVSRVTVSKALRGHTDISPGMTSRIRTMANELGYTPNIMARNLSSRRSHMIGLVVPKIAHHFFSSVIEGVYDTAFQNHYETILTVSQENAERELLHLRTLVSMRVDGIIISVSSETHGLERFQWIRDLGIPLVFVDRRPAGRLAGFSTVLTDDRAGTFRAIEHAISIGHRKLGFIGGRTNVNIGQERLEGFQDALKAHRILVNQDWIVPGGYGKDDGETAMRRLCQKGAMPEFVFAVTYPVALGILDAAKDLNVRIPEDLDIMCFGDSDVGRLLAPAISVVRQPTRELGSRAVEVLLESLAGQNTGSEQHLVLPTELVIRETCTEKTGPGRRSVTGHG